jgi:hypothetical protein
LEFKYKYKKSLLEKYTLKSSISFYDVLNPINVITNSSVNSIVIFAGPDPRAASYSDLVPAAISLFDHQRRTQVNLIEEKTQSTRKYFK